MWFYKGVSVDVSYLQINDILEDNPPYLQSGCWHCQSNTSKLNLGNSFYSTIWGPTQKSTEKTCSNLIKFCLYCNPQ